MKLKSRKDKLDTIYQIFQILLIIFGIFIIYQMLRLLLGGSWKIEEVILTLIVLSTGINMAFLIRAEKNASDLSTLKKLFFALARDFKKHMQEDTCRIFKPVGQRSLLWAI